MGRRRLLMIMSVYCLVLVIILKIKIFVCVSVSVSVSVRWGQLGKEWKTLYSSTTKQFSTNK